MYKTPILTLVIAAVVALPLPAQTNQRRASISGNGNPNDGKCTIDVLVSGPADIEIRGDSALVLDGSGRRSELRGFDCTARMPDYPAGLRVRAIAGRGNVQLTPDQRNGAVTLHIDGYPGGSERYTLELGWAAGSYPNGDPNAGGRPDGFGIGSNSNQRRDLANQAERAGSAFSPDDAVRVCQDSVRQQAGTRLGPGNLEFRSAGLDNNPQRQDWVTGAFAYFARNRGEVIYNYSCSMDFAGGRVRSVQIDQAGGDAYAAAPPRMPSPIDPAVRSCKDAVEARLGRMGYSSVSFNAAGLDQRAGRNDLVVGNAEGDRGYRSARFDFSCRINLNSGSVRSVSVTRR